MRKESRYREKNYPLWARIWAVWRHRFLPQAWSLDPPLGSGLFEFPDLIPIPSLTALISRLNQSWSQLFRPLWNGLSQAWSQMERTISLHALLTRVSYVAESMVDLTSLIKCIFWQQTTLKSFLSWVHLWANESDTSSFWSIQLRLKLQTLQKSLSETCLPRLWRFWDQACRRVGIRPFSLFSGTD